MRPLPQKTARSAVWLSYETSKIKCDSQHQMEGVFVHITGLVSLIEHLHDVGADGGILRASAGEIAHDELR